MSRSYIPRCRSAWSRSAFALSLAAAGIACTPALAHNDDSDGNKKGGPTVSISDGKVQGYTKNGVNVFLGIPYAAPPVGKLRWQPPQPVGKWKGTLDATQFANTCPQVTELGAFAGPTSTTEDCLYLNVFTSGNSSKKKGVIVWIHGGGNVDGESNDYDGTKLAQGGPDGKETVVVTLNYRMGLFGYLSHPALNSEGHLWGNYGIMDIQAVLRWVQRNIAAFGGDPNKVAVGGQSAGATDTGANVLSPLAANLFNRAIYESGPLPNLPAAATAQTNGQNFAAAAGCPTTSGKPAAACLRDLTAARILQLQGTPNANGPYITGPFVDGTVIPITPEKAWTTGKYNKMPTMGGRVRDEGNFGISITEYFSGPPQVPMTADQFTAAVTRTYSGNAGPGGAPPAYPAGTATAVLNQYPLSAYGNDPVKAYNRVTTDAQKCQADHVLNLWAPQISTYGYDFTYSDAPYYFPKMPGFKPNAAHTIDIQFLFNNWHGGQLGVNLDQTTGMPRDLNQTESKLSDQLVAAWTNFAATGNPNGSGNSPWPKYAGGNASYLVQDIPLSTNGRSSYRATYKCDFWDTVLLYPLQ
ncbi:carboxylesterase/lipase family protein [Hyphomicrobium facile]|uniref:Carboxylic ester hydrolase n=1 Tax=Hyphomicrobium facile TaxID=51670 RepID=A0A1I7NTZ0_9HYPH|nr:carboxylesterase family protein [Hyphomicrobium facile]SFV38125.1 para-nitrobenzyl esterase [Hyphomicrobium facile]